MLRRLFQCVTLANVALQNPHVHFEVLPFNCKVQ
jgi:hypothetical protein